MATANLLIDRRLLFASHFNMRCGEFSVADQICGDQLFRSRQRLHHIAGQYTVRTIP
ncbi:MAG TPA: hypothetical protein VFE62_00940 [Gemmataceae bacterium]|nr:hypothetical protein [Gemmataceae bacterium]